jgi:cyclophilin family peptidyl-prolyl cis-trans isomerase
LDGEHVVFGYVLKGNKMLTEISQYGKKGEPTRKITISDCGIANLYIKEKKLKDEIPPVILYV